MVQVAANAPDGWDELCAADPSAQLTHSRAWNDLAATHYPAAHSVWLSVRDGGRLVAGLVLLARARRGLVRLESSFEGTTGGPIVAADCEPAVQDELRRAVVVAAASRLRGRTGLVAMTLAGAAREATAQGIAGPRWRRDDYETAVVDCRGGLDQVGTELWTNNRRNERNRGLKRGATLHTGSDPDALAAWYPIYTRKAHQWAQAPVPLGFLQALLRACPDRVVFDHVRLAGEVVAGHLGYVSGGRLLAWQGAARPDLARSHFLTTLLYWRNVMTACERGLDAVDFGGSVGRDSLWDFKRRCGAEPEPRTQLLGRSWYGHAHRRLAALLRAGRGGEP